MQSTDRRRFLKMSFMVGTGLVNEKLEKDVPNWVRHARAAIPATTENIYFQTGGIGPSSQRVLERVSELHKLQNQSPANPRYSQELQKAEDACRPLVAEAFGADTSEVALTHNTSEGLNIAIWSIDWKHDDEILISDEEHPALIIPTYNLHKRIGVNYRKFAFDTDSIVANVTKQITPSTRLVAMSHVSRRTGRRIPAYELSKALRRRGIRFLLDGAQSAGQVPVNFHNLGCDYYSLCGHKWILGPKGTGALLIRKEIIDSTPVSWTGAHGQKLFDDDGNLEWLPSAQRYEFGTRAQAVFGGFAEALQYMKELGWERIYARVEMLSEKAIELINASTKLKLVSPYLQQHHSGLLVLRLPKGSDGPAIYSQLHQNDGILVSSLPNPRDIRICVHFFNTKHELEQLIDRIESYV